MADDTNKKDNAMNPLDLIGFGSSLINYFGQLGQQNRAFQMNKELASYQNKLNVDQWNRENAYNTPMAMMARYKQAGMNPNLAYGLQNLSANSPQLVGGTPAQQTNSNIIDSQTIAQLDLLKAQKDNLDADTQDKLAGAGLKDKQKANIGFEQYMAQQRLELDTKLANSNIELNEANKQLINETTRKVSEEILNLGVERSIQEINRNWLTATYDDRVAMVTAELRKTNAETRKINAEANRIVKLMDQELRNLEASFDEINARTDLNKQQKENLIQQKTVDMMDNFYLFAAEEAGKDGENFKFTCNMLRHMITHGIIRIGKV